MSQAIQSYHRALKNRKCKRKSQNLAKTLRMRTLSQIYWSVNSISFPESSLPLSNGGRSTAEQG